MTSVLLAVALLTADPVCHPDRDSRGHIARSPSQRRAFCATHPCPSTGATRGRCPGYTVDHVCPLSCCGPDAPSNMQWQTEAEAKAKDRWERSCSTCRPEVMR
jgi:hypothetical protein